MELAPATGESGRRRIPLADGGKLSNGSPINGNQVLTLGPKTLAGVCAAPGGKRFILMERKASGPTSIKTRHPMVKLGGSLVSLRKDKALGIVSLVLAGRTKHPRHLRQVSVKL